jgi:hypothetical protein
VRTLKDSGALNPGGQGGVTFFTSGDYGAYHDRFETLLRQPMHIDGIEL